MTAHPPGIENATADRRAYPRISLLLDALVKINGDPPRACTIRDFSRGGLFIGYAKGSPEDEDTGASREIRPTDAAEVEFVADALGEMQRFRLVVEVTRTFMGGFGAAFKAVDPQALRALQAHAERNRSEPKTAPTLDSKAILELCRELVSERLSALLPELFRGIEDRLLATASTSKNNVEQGHYFDAMTALGTLKDDVQETFREAVLKNVEALESGEPASVSKLDDPLSELSLVDQEDFEDWLAVAQMIPKAESRFQNQLFEIEKRFGHLSKAEIDDENNPIGPASLGRAFHTSVQKLDAHYVAKKVIYKVFEEAIVAKLAGLYDGLNEVLTQSGILPDLTRASSSKKAAPVPPVPQPADFEVDTSSEAAAIPGAADAFATPARAHTTGGVSGPPEPTSPQTAPVSQPVGRAAESPSTPAAAAAGTRDSSSRGAAMRGGPAPGPQAGAAEGSSAIPGVHDVAQVGSRVGGYPSHGGVQGSPSGTDERAPGSSEAAVAGPAGPAHQVPAGPTGPAPAGAIRTGAVPSGTISAAAMPASAVVTGPTSVTGLAATAPGPTTDSRSREASAPGPARPAASGAQDVYDTARTLIGLRRQKGTAVAQGLADEAAAEAVSPSGPTYARDEVLKGLLNLQASQATVPGGELTSRVQDALAETQAGGPLKHLGEPERDVIEVVETLFYSILEDALVNDGVKPWINKLQTPLLRAAILDEAFLRAKSHPARQVLNQLTKLGVSVESEGPQGPVRRTVDPLVDHIARDFDEDVSVFAEAKEKLDALVASQAKSYAENLRAVVKEFEDQQSLKRARHAVYEQINRRIGGKRVPKAAMLLLNAGWRELLVNTYLEDGPNGESWQQYLHTLDSLLIRLGGEDFVAEAEPALGTAGLLKLIDRGFDQVSYNQVQLDELLDELEAVLVGDEEGTKRAPEMVDVPRHEFDPAAHAPAGERESGQQTSAEWALWLNRAKRIRQGAVVEFSYRSQTPQRVTLAWVSDDFNTFVFVDDLGTKVDTLSLQELAMYLRRGQAAVVDDADLPVMDRAQHTMLNKIYGQLAHEATHDPLTGLANRKEFERNVERAFASAKRSKAQHVLCYFDLDQFKIINNACGHRAGDELVKQIADLLRAEAGNQSVLARLGGDEFGVLLENCSVDKGIELGERSRKAIEEHRFTWEGKRFSVSVSIGLVGITDQSADVATLFKAADSACYAAKDAGRNRIQVYSVDDSELAHRDGMMEWIARINKTLDEDRLRLRCQRIRPIVEDGSSQPHYEVLLGIQDEDGNDVPPYVFIEAAELYDRMKEVDRWVIRSAFRWMAENLDILEDLSGLAINLSGQSLNDEGLMDYVLEQFEAFRIPKEKVCFEVTETAGINNLTSAAEFIRELKTMGCRFSIDDFGSGLASYSYLKNLPVDYVKIDGIFVKDIVDNPNDYAVVKSITEIGHFMGKKTIAEYVENDEILEKLREIGVDYAQGYGIEKPRLLEELAAA